MAEWEGALRLGVFSGLFIVLALLEVWQPFRKASRRRWLANLGLLAIGSVALRVVFPLAATGVALWAQQQSWGLLNQIEWPALLEIILAVAVLDCAIYWQHRVFHRLPWLWRLHSVHHADTALDVTTGLRFHPIELLLSMVIKSVFIVALGAPALAVLIFEVVLNACSMFNHSNIALPNTLEHSLRRVLITPTLHRIHHSQRVEETNSNFGFSVPWWDWLFGSFRSQAREGDAAVRLGLPGAQQRAGQLLALLILPFRREGNGPRNNT